MIVVARKDVYSGADVLHLLLQIRVVRETTEPATADVALIHANGVGMFGGRSGAAAYSFKAGEYGLYGPGDPRTEFLAALGFKLPAELATLVPANSFFTTLSAEQLRLLDRDVLVWFTLTADERPALEASPLYQGLRAAQEGRDVFLGTDPALGTPQEALDVVIGEVKEGRARLNPGLRRQDTVAFALRRVGCCPEQLVEEQARAVVREGRREMVMAGGLRCVVRIVAFAGRGVGAPGAAATVARVLAQAVHANLIRIRARSGIRA